MTYSQFNDNFKILIEPLISNKGDIGMSLKHMIIQREQELKISRNQLEKLLKIEKKTLNGILDNTAKRVDVVNIIKLAVFLNIRIEEFMELYINELPPDTIREIENARKSNYIASNFDLEQLTRIKFIKKSDTIDQIENRIKDFFGLNNIFEYSNNFHYPLFSRTKNSSNNKMRDFWIRSAINQFESVNNPNEFDRDSLIELIKKIKPYSMNIEKGLITVARALFNVGVTVIFQRSLPSVQVRGATMYIKNKPCIVITDLFKNYPTLWFALLHELHHVLYDLEEIQNRKYHLSGEPDLFLLNEDAANLFARDYFLDEEKTRFIEPLINNEFIVIDFAKKCQIDPSFIYQFYMHDSKEKGEEGAYRKSHNKKTSRDVEIALKNFNLNPWEKENIYEAVDEIKKTVYNLN